PQRGMPRKSRPQQTELAVTRDQKIDHLLVALARLQSFAHKDTQVAREWRIGIVDRLILADHAAQLHGESARTCFQRSVGKDFVGPERNRRRENQEPEHRGEKTEPAQMALRRW